MAEENNNSNTPAPDTKTAGWTSNTPAPDSNAKQDDEPGSEPAVVEADEENVDGGPSHMDLLNTSMHIDRRLKAIENGEEPPPAPQPRVMNVPEGHQPNPGPKWEPGK